MRDHFDAALVRHRTFSRVGGGLPILFVQCGDEVTSSAVLVSEGAAPSAVLSGPASADRLGFVEDFGPPLAELGVLGSQSFVACALEHVPSLVELR